MAKKESLYVIPEGCICVGDGLMGMTCTAIEHAYPKGANPMTQSSDYQRGYADGLAAGRERSEAKDRLTEIYRRNHILCRRKSGMQTWDARCGICKAYDSLNPPSRCGG